MKLKILESNRSGWSEYYKPNRSLKELEKNTYNNMI